MHRAVLMASGDEIGADASFRRMGTASTPRGHHQGGACHHGCRTGDPRTVGRTVADVERDLILETLKHCLGNRTHAANILGISIRTLRNKLNEYADDGQPIPPPNSGEMRGVAAA